jgi:hypothetical protein
MRWEGSVFALPYFFFTSELVIFNFAVLFPALSVAALSEFHATSDCWIIILALIPFRSRHVGNIDTRRRVPVFSPLQILIRHLITATDRSQAVKKSASHMICGL